MGTRRQFLLGSAAAVAGAALPSIPAVQGVMPFPEPDPAFAAAYKLIWDSEQEIVQMTYIPFEKLYIEGGL